MNRHLTGQAIEMAIQGTEQQEIADTLGMSQSHISRTLKYHRELIDTCMKKIVDESLEKTVEAVNDDLTTSSAISKKKLIETTDREMEFQKTIGMKVRGEVLKSVGIFPSHAQSLIVQNIYQQNNQTVLSSNVKDFLGKISGGLTDPDTIIDVVAEEKSQNTDETGDNTDM